MRTSILNASLATILAFWAGIVCAQARPDMGKLLATGGVTQVEGAGGGGLVPWALITGYGTEDSYGANAHITAVRTQDYALDTQGIALGLADRLEISLARQHFKGTGGPLDDVSVGQDIFGLKLKLAGDALYGQDDRLPQISIGLMSKHHTGIKGLAGVSSVKDIGARREHGMDYYITATKLLLSHRLLLNGTLRATRANQMGLLGFGGDGRNRYQLMPEVSVAYLVNRSLVVGGEYRMKPDDNLRFDDEQDYYDAFVAYLPSKNFSLTAAYVALGDITILSPKRQRGVYLSLQTGF
ncbi:MAG: DUF3034 family protein [Pseudomonadota bacterium]